MTYVVEWSWCGQVAVDSKSNRSCNHRLRLNVSSTHWRSFWRRVFPVITCTGTDNQTRTAKRQGTGKSQNNLTQSKWL